MRTDHSPSKEKKLTLSIRDVAVLGMMVAVLEVSKRLLDSLPNVELITFLLIMFTLFFGKKVILASFAFTALEVAWWGVHVWVIMYLYMWPLLVLLTDLLHKRIREREAETDDGNCESGAPPKASLKVWPFAILSATFGLSFGALCSIPYLVIGGPVMMVTWWIAGIPYDILHCFSNFLICLALFRPVYSALSKAEQYL